MPSAPTERRLAAILFTDIVGSTAVTARSESAGLALRDRHRELVRTQVERYHGRFIEAPGDESLSTFESAVDAVHVALAIQKELEGDSELQVRIGIHLGETMFRGDEVFGDGVNIAARIRELAEPGQILVSGEVARAIQNQPNVETSPRGEHKLKGIEGSVMVHAARGTVAEPSAAPHAVAQPTRPAGRWFTAASALAVLAVLALAWWLYEPETAGPPLTSIAVLPFDDMSPGGDHKWLADGMAEELIESLSRIQQLRVPARTSTFRLRGEDIETVSQKLNVGSVVEGSVRRSGDQLRITAQLIRVSDGYHMWSARYDRAVDDVFAIQTELAREIAEAIRTELEIPEEFFRGFSRDRYVPRDVRAYELTLKGFERGLLGDFQEASLRQSEAYYLEALEIDPTFPAAHSGLGWNHYILWFSGFDRTDARIASAHAAVERALELEETRGGAHQFLALRSFQTGDYEGAERRLERAIEADSQHGGLRAVYALVLTSTGRIDAALVQARRSADLNSLMAAPLGELARVQLLAGDYEAAIQSAERALELNPPVLAQVLNTVGTLAFSYHAKGMDERAIEAWIGYMPDFEAPMRDGFAAGGWKGAIRAFAGVLTSQAGLCFARPDIAAIVYAWAGDEDSMYQCLDESTELFGDTNLALRLAPWWEPYRDDLRFQEILRRVGLAE